MQELDSESVLKYIKTRSCPQLIKLFKVKRVKEIIINDFSKEEFQNLLIKDSDGTLLTTLLDPE
jgi:hypothetical protein